MTIIFDWPSIIVPSQQVFYAGGAAQDGGFTIGGSSILTPEAGGRASLEAAFGYAIRPLGPRIASWLMSKINNGNVFRIPISVSAQLVSAVDLGLDDSYDSNGVSWDNDQPWDTGFNWLFEPVCLVTVGASEGSAVLTVDMTPFGSALNYGHLVGLGGRAYIIDDIDPTVETAAVLTLNPPLRTDVAVGDLLTLRPTMLGTVADPTTFRAKFERTGLVQIGSITFNEALP